MLNIVTEDGKCLFYGNEWDFDRSGNNFKKLLEKLNIEVEIINDDMSDG
jgi:hypothetical protein